MFNCLVDASGAILLWTRAPITEVPEGCTVYPTEALGNPADYVYDAKLGLLEKTEETKAREAQVAVARGVAHEEANHQVVEKLLELVDAVKDAKVKAAFTALLAYLRIEGEEKG